ncbi:hypothetical protein RE476_08765 [Methanolobus mangrovi]|uniref:Uncharacterized protein n=1 Tax=Methanolobus mangrovi TaxID=3072977 RepID=A0AA51UGX3_9EURY|nr:hypothetical protein [Methanolobus mangrovi]WMW21491.1 hypothetical protein RE476_08765 [Methanolobus mangrovi]
MDLFSVILIAITLFVVFVLLTAYFLKSYIVMNSIDNKGEEDGSLDKEEPSVIPETDEQK